MKEPNTSENVYILLPRFVTEPEDINYIEEKYLPALVRDFELENRKFSFVISPARVRSEASEDRYYYPGVREKLIEEGLRRLTVDDNINFRAAESTLDFTLTQLMNEIYCLNGDSNPKLKREDVELGMKILGDVKYELLGSTSEFYFRPIEKLIIRKENEEVYYRAQFSELFFTRTRQFDFCFPHQNVE